MTEKKPSGRVIFLRGGSRPPEPPEGSEPGEGRPKTTEELLTEIFHLTNISANVAKSNSLLRAKIEDLEKGIEGHSVLEGQLEDALEENAALREEIEEKDQRIEFLEDCSDPSTITENVHAFLRLERLLPTELDVPLVITTHAYLNGLYAAIQRHIPDDDKEESPWQH